MKKIKSMVIFTLLALVLTACGNSDSTETNSNGVKDTQNGGITTEAEEDKKDNEGEKFDGILTEEILRNHKVSPESDFEWKKTSDGVIISKYIGNDDIVVIPETFDGKNVTEISTTIFSNNDDVIGVLLPKTVTSLTKCSFFGCAKLQMVISDGAEEIGTIAFQDCPELRTVILSNNLNRIEDGAFAGCYKLEKLRIPSTLQKVLESAPGYSFAACKKLTIYGEAGSFIEQYCKDNNISFQAE